MEKLLPGDYFWNILPTEQGLELITSQFYVGCGYLLFYLGMAGVGCGCGLGFLVYSRLHWKVTSRLHPTTYCDVPICCILKAFHVDYLTWQNFRNGIPFV